MCAAGEPAGEPPAGQAPHSGYSIQTKEAQVMFLSKYPRLESKIISIYGDYLDKEPHLPWAKKSWNACRESWGRLSDEILRRMDDAADGARVIGPPNYRGSEKTLLFGSVLVTGEHGKSCRPVLIEDILWLHLSTFTHRVNFIPTSVEVSIVIHTRYHEDLILVKCASKLIGKHEELNDTITSLAAELMKNGRPGLLTGYSQKLESLWTSDFAGFVREADERNRQLAQAGAAQRSAGTAQPSAGAVRQSEDNTREAGESTRKSEETARKSEETAHRSGETARREPPRSSGSAASSGSARSAAASSSGSAHSAATASSGSAGSASASSSGPKRPASAPSSGQSGTYGHYVGIDYLPSVTVPGSWDFRVCLYYGSRISYLSSGPGEVLTYDGLPLTYETLHRIRKDVESHTGRIPYAAILTIPAATGISGRQYIKTLTEQAGFKKTADINTAVAQASLSDLAFNAGRPEGSYILSIVMRGETVRISVSNHGGGVVEQLTSGEYICTPGRGRDQAWQMIRQLIHNVSPGDNALKNHTLIVYSRSAQTSEDALQAFPVAKSILPDAPDLDVGENMPARGAALLGAKLSGDSSVLDFLLLKAVEHSIYFANADAEEGFCIIDAGSTLPFRSEFSLTIAKGSPGDLEFVLYEGDSPQMSRNTRLGRFRVTGLPKTAAEDTEISIAVDIEAHDPMPKVTAACADGRKLTVE